MKSIKFLENKINEHYKNGGSALNINTSMKTIICEWMDEYKQFSQHDVSVSVCDNIHCVDGVVSEIYGEKVYCHKCRD